MTATGRRCFRLAFGVAGALMGQLAVRTEALLFTIVLPDDDL